MMLWLPRPVWRAVQTVKLAAWLMLAMLALGAVELREVLRIAAAALDAIASAM